MYGYGHLMKMCGRWGSGKTLCLDDPCGSFAKRDDGSEEELGCLPHTTNAVMRMAGACGVSGRFKERGMFSCLVFHLSLGCSS